MASNHLHRLAPVLWVSFLALLIAGPWLSPGYVFGTDFAGPRRFDFPDFPASYAALQMGLALAALALPAEVVGKALIVAIFLCAGLSAHHAAPTGSFAPRAVAALVYMINPFVYDRLAYGQLTVLAGYAVLPLVALVMRRLLVQPTMPRALVVATTLALVGILDIHIALIAAVLSAAFVVAYMSLDEQTPIRLFRLGGYVLVAAVAALAASAYWLLPILTGRGSEAQTLARIGGADLTAFRTASDPSLGLLPNVLGLYGFWAETTGRFASMKEFVVMWPLALALLLVLVCAGIIGGWKVRAPDSGHTRPWVAAMVLAGAAAVILEIGASDTHTAPLIHWLNTTFSPYRGMRDASKWAAALALAYSQLIAIGVVVLLRFIVVRFKSSLRSQELAVGLVGAVVLGLPLYYGNGLLYGMHGQIRPSAYPVGWYEADHILAADAVPARTVFLPWHGYLALSFVQNANHVIASPAPQFFSVPVVASQDLEIPGIAPPLDDPDQAAIGRLVQSAGQGDWAADLAQRNFKYVLLAREGDWTNYGYLSKQSGLILVGDYKTIILYRNTLWH